MENNQHQCPRCKEILTSKHNYDIQKCSCGALAIDGGENLRIIEIDATAFTDQVLKNMKAVLLKDIKDFQAFKFSEYESTCIKTPVRSGSLISYASISRKTFFAHPNTLVYRSNEQLKTPWR